MGFVDIVKGYFKTGRKPTEQEFAEFLDYIRFKDTKLPMNQVSGLVDYLESLGGNSSPEIDPTIPSHIKEITAAQILSWNSGFDYANILNHGAPTDGVSDATPALNAAAATGKRVFIPPGTFVVNGHVMPDDAVYFGTGAKSILKVTTNGRCINIGAKCEVKDVKFLGTGKDDGKPWQTGIFAYQKLGWLIDGCFFENIAGAKGNNGGGGVFAADISPANSEGGRIINPYGKNNNCTLNFDQRGEYVTVINPKINGDNCGIAIGAGNIIVTGGDVQNCVDGLYMYFGSNNGHGIITGVTFNHNTNTFNINNTTEGMTISNCNFYQGNGIITNSKGIKFIGCDFCTGDSITLTNNQKLLRMACRVPIAPTPAAIPIIVVSGENFTEANNLDF